MVDYICILDFEATCWESNDNHEIIEFPSVLLRWDNEDNSVREISRIQIFVKPKSIPIVSPFCNNLTGITQNQIDNGFDFETANRMHFNWLKKTCNVINTNVNVNVDIDIDTVCTNADINVDPTTTNALTLDNVIIVTCGHWDIFTMYPSDIKNIGMKPPDKVYSRYVNIKAPFHKITNTKGRSMIYMLKYFDLDVEGRHHSGIDDCHNISRIFIKLVESGLCKNTFLEYLHYV